MRWNTGEDGRENCKDTSNFVDSLHTSSMDSFIFLRDTSFDKYNFSFTFVRSGYSFSEVRCDAKWNSWKSKGCLQIFEMAKVCTNL